MAFLIVISIVTLLSFSTTAFAERSAWQESMEDKKGIIKMKKRIFVIFTVAIMILMTACSSQQKIQPVATANIDDNHEEVSQPAEDVVQEDSQPTVSVAGDSQATQSVIEPIFDDNDTRYISNSSDKYSYETFDELNEIASYVVAGVCISSKPIFQNDMLYTLSELKIDDVYRGDTIAKGDTILIMELGGRTTSGEYRENCHIEKKAFETGESMPPEKKLVMGMDGYFPLQENEQVLLFLGDETGFLKNIKEPLFGIWGAYDGKLFLQPDGLTYSRPMPAQTDKLQFGGETLSITVDELKEKVK